ncbi:hypothetical protein PLGE761_07260 [Pluralibacter gergoviae]|nr:Uncharacterised protein [Pluralibacter gergoviae]
MRRKMSPCMSYKIENFFYIHPKCLTDSDYDFPEWSSIQMCEGCLRVIEIVYFINHRFYPITVNSQT